MAPQERRSRSGPVLRRSRAAARGGSSARSRCLGCHPVWGCTPPKVGTSAAVMSWRSLTYRMPPDPRVLGGVPADLRHTSGLHQHRVKNVSAPAAGRESYAGPWVFGVGRSERVGDLGGCGRLQRDRLPDQPQTPAHVKAAQEENLRSTEGCAARAACGERWEAVALHVGAPVVGRSAVTLVDPALGNDLARVPCCLRVAHTFWCTSPRDRPRLRTSSATSPQSAGSAHGPASAPPWARADARRASLAVLRTSHRSRSLRTGRRMPGRGRGPSRGRARPDHRDHRPGRERA